MSDDWSAKYGDKILKVIGEFCLKNGEGVPMDTLPQKEAKPEEKLIKVRTHSCFLTLYMYIFNDAQLQL